jgi:hypothetical protein
VTRLDLDVCMVMCSQAIRSDEEPMKRNDRRSKSKCKRMQSIDTSAGNLARQDTTPSRTRLSPDVHCPEHPGRMMHHSELR